MLVLKAKGDTLGNNRIQLDHPMCLRFQKYMFWHLRDKKEDARSKLILEQNNIKKRSSHR